MKLKIANEENNTNNTLQFPNTKKHRTSFPSSFVRLTFDLLFRASSRFVSYACAIRLSSTVNTPAQLTPAARYYGAVVSKHVLCTTSLSLSYWPFVRQPQTQTQILLPVEGDHRCGPSRRRRLLCCSTALSVCLSVQSVCLSSLSVCPVYLSVCPHTRTPAAADSSLLRTIHSTPHSPPSTQRGSTQAHLCWFPRETSCNRRLLEQCSEVSVVSWHR